MSAATPLNFGDEPFDAPYAIRLEWWQRQLDAAEPHTSHWYDCREKVRSFRRLAQAEQNKTSAYAATIRRGGSLQPGQGAEEPGTSTIANSLGVATESAWACPKTQDAGVQQASPRGDQRGLETGRFSCAWCRGSLGPCLVCGKGTR